MLSNPKLHALQRPLLALALLGWAVCAPAVADDSKLLMKGASLTELPNGLRLILREQHAAPLVAIDVWIRAGSGAERPAEAGAAHFLEHMLFKGTPSRKPGEIDAAIEDMGATLGASTSRDAAHLFTTVRSADFQNAIQVIADAVQHSNLPGTEMERERAVILDELARASGDSAKQAWNRLFAELMRGQAYARPILGDADAIRSLSRETMLSFYRRNYEPGRVTICIVGDVPHDLAESTVQDSFGSWPRSITERPAAPIASASVVESIPDKTPSLRTTEAQTIRTVTGPLPSGPAGFARLSIGFKIPKLTDAREQAAGIIAAALLADPESSRIQRALTSVVTIRAGSERLATPTPPWFMNLAGDFTILNGDSLFGVTASVSVVGTRISEFQSATTSEIERLRTTAPLPDELDQARRRVIGAYLYDIETYAGQARALGAADVQSTFTAAQDLVDRLLSVKAADVTAFAKARLTPENRCDVILGGTDGKAKP